MKQPLRSIATATPMPLLGAALGALVFVACSRPADQDGAASQLTVVSTATMLTDALEVLAGDRMTVIGLLDAGMDPHTHVLKDEDQVLLLGADLIVYLADSFEIEMLEEFEQFRSAGRTVVEASAVLPEDSWIQEDGHQDPHIWGDPMLWKQVVSGLADSLTELDPEGEAQYADAAETYLGQIDGLDRFVAQAIETIPDASRALVTVHDAMSYFARRYGLEVIALNDEVTTETEPGLKRIEDVASALAERNIQAVFAESTTSDQGVLAVLEGARARGSQVELGGKVYADATGPAGTYEGTYLGMVDHNATTITRALGGSAPEDGWKGKLGAER